MQPNSAAASRALVIQLARLGDLIQTLPVLDAVRHHRPGTAVDLLCAAPLADFVRAAFPVDRVLPWDGRQCRDWADTWCRDPSGTVQRLQRYIESLSPQGYDEAYNLNQHERAILAAHLLGRCVTGAGATGPLSTELGVWGDYLRQVACRRGNNRIHLADAFCGLCGVRPRGGTPSLRRGAETLPRDLQSIGRDEGDWAAIVIGAGDADRCVPPQAWTAWVETFLSIHERGKVVLVGAGGEREAAHAVQSSLASMHLARVWDATGRTSLPQLAEILSRCAWTIGADTGPLHIGTAVASCVIGFYFARARVHETGPYGTGHWVFQHQGGFPPSQWPIRASIELMLHGTASADAEWELWMSDLDEWGAFYVKASGDSDRDRFQRRKVWETLSPSLAGCNEHI
ncbi:MAG TPA: glycosyltransferase family 9 protein [Nitrospiraceae bacterium]|nr:glycosyltransferase family 9 protein [Nitrospiraceae bacterium]